MGLVLGVFVGLVLGLTGAGGSILAVPLLMFGLGWTLVEAVPVALLAVASAAALGTYLAWRKSYVRYRAAALMSAIGLFTAPLGLHVAEAIPGKALSLTFAGVLLAVGVRLFLQARQSPRETEVVRATVHGDGEAARGPICGLNPATGRIIWKRPCAIAISMTGAVTGFLSGLLGVGGGFVIVPALRFATPLSMHSAVATSLMAITLTSAATVLIATAQGRPLPLDVALLFVTGALAGMLLAHYWLAPRLAGPRLQQGFAILMVLVAGLMATGYAA